MPLSAVFHTSSLQKQVAALSDAFAIAGEFLHCDVINSGHINMTFRATYRKPDGTTRRYIFQRVNDAVFPCPRDVMHNVEKVTNHIRWKMLRVLKTPFRQTLNLYSARGGRKYLEIPGSGFWRCYNCIENTHTFDVADHPRQAYEAARAFGAFQQLLCDMNPELIRKAEANLDTVMPGSVLYDFGDMVRTMTSPAAEDEENLDKTFLRMPMFEAVVKGYLEASREFITPQEVSKLAFSGLLITLETGIRFLTDYLEGDVYFKTKKERHNLHRARTQLRLVESMEEQMPEMEKCVRECFQTVNG